MNRIARIERDAARDLTTFFDVSLDMLVIRDLDGRFVKANRAWETALGYRVEELVGQPMLAFIHPEDAAASRGRMVSIDADADGKIVGFVNRYRHKDGSYRFFEWRARKMGELVFGVARDVTERMAFEAELKAAKLAAEAANRAKSDFLANMSHEIRTPLNGVIGVAAALAQTGLAPDQREMLQLVQSSGEMLERLVSDVLDLSKIEAGRLELETRVFDLHGELDGVIEVNRCRAHDKGLTFRVDYGETTRGGFHGDPTRIKQIIGNLLSNAVKFTERGEVALRVDVAEADQACAPARVTFQVTDTGIGFDAAAAAQLFQRFNQADATINRRFGGTGLGLSISKSLAELMGGDVSARSEPGRGSSFTLVLPLARSNPTARRDTAWTPGDVDAGETAFGRARPLRVLLAEDHPTNQKVVQLILAPFGAEIVTVGDGAQAVDAFRPGDFDVVLMDMQMPVMDGLAATAALRRVEARAPAAPQTPVIVLTANAMQQHCEAALAAGADLHLAKPISARSLIEGIEQAIAQRADGFASIRAAAAG
jgi:two-component system, sensor histidine kinase